MIMNTGEKLASIHTKIRAIHDRLDGAERNLEYSKCGGDDEAESCATSTIDLETGGTKPVNMRTNARSKLGSWCKEAIEVLRRKLSAIREAIQRQSFYAHCFKLLTLFVVALMHLVYLHPFLEMFSVLEDYSTNINTKLQIEPKKAFYAHETNVLKSQMEALTDYKKNIWMSVAAMCVALSTSCFFLFILPVTRIRKFHIALVGVIDLIAFGTLPVLLATRAGLVFNLHLHLPDALKSAHKLVSAESLMNAIQCTILPRERLPFCSQLILNSIFPVVLLKYLLVLCVMTLAYLLTAYFIEWCIRHWFPPHCCCCSKYTTYSCGCCRSITDSKKYKSVCKLKSPKNSSCGGCCNKSKYENFYPTGHKVWRPPQEYSRKPYAPSILYPGFEPEEVSAPEMAYVLPPQTVHPLAKTLETLPAKAASPLLEEEPIPAEPKPSDCN